VIMVDFKLRFMWTWMARLGRVIPAEFKTIPSWKITHIAGLEFCQWSRIVLRRVWFSGGADR
jgi:hypothetical protein